MSPSSPGNSKPDPISPADLVRTEAAALTALAARLEGSMAAAFARAVDLILCCGEQNGRVAATVAWVVSGIIAQKHRRHAQLHRGSPVSCSLHPAEAVHGDLGILMPGDVVIALSASGETEEILRLLATVKRKGDALVSFCCNLASTLATASDVALDCSVEREACGLNLAPTASTTAMLALGDALAVAVSLRKGFRAGDFAENFILGGKLGKQLALVRDLRALGRRRSLSSPLATPMTDVIFEMSSKKLGITTRAAGRQTLRRHLRRRSAPPARREGGAGTQQNRRRRHERPSAHHRIERPSPRALAILEQGQITSLIVVDAAQNVEGVVHLHDLRWGVELIRTPGTALPIAAWPVPPSTPAHRSGLRLGRCDRDYWRAAAGACWPR